MLFCRILFEDVDRQEGESIHQHLSVPTGSHFFCNCSGGDDDDDDDDDDKD